jgi:hypothetical protein
MPKISDEIFVHENNYFLASATILSRVQAEHSAPPYGLSGLFFVLGILAIL